MKSITKADLKLRDELCSQIRKAHEALEVAVDAFNNAMVEPWGAVEDALEKYNSIVSDLESWKEDITSQIQEYIDERSEKWQEGDRGQAYQEWLSAYENTSIESVEMSMPDTVDFNVEGVADDIESLPENPN